MTLSVMDELEFTTTFDCVKCTKLDSDLKQAKTENEELQKVITAMKTQIDKTRALIQKFASQKQKMDNLEKQNKRLKAEVEVCTSQLKNHLDSQDDAMFSERERLKLQNIIDGQKTHITQFTVKCTELEDSNKKLKEENIELKAKCKKSISSLAEVRSKEKTPSQEEVSELKAEIAKLKRNNTLLKQNQESAVNNLADKKNKDIMKKLADMTSYHSRMEAQMKEILDTVKTTPSDSFRGNESSSVGLRSRKRSLHVSKESPRKLVRKAPKRAGLKSDSDCESVTHATTKKFPRQASRLKKQGSRPKAEESFNGFTKSKTLSDCSSNEDEDSDLINQIETSFQFEGAALGESANDTIRCDSPPKQFEIFDSPGNSSFQIPDTNHESPKSSKSVTAVKGVIGFNRANVENVYQLMISTHPISPLPIPLSNSVIKVSFKDDVKSDIPTTPSCLSVSKEIDDKEPVLNQIASTGMVPDVELKTEGKFSVGDGDPQENLEFQPITIKNKKFRHKIEDSTAVLTVGPMKKVQTRAVPIVTAISDELTSGSVNGPVKQEFELQDDIVQQETNNAVESDDQMGGKLTEQGPQLSQLPEGGSVVKEDPDPVQVLCDRNDSTLLRNDREISDRNDKKITPVPAPDLNCVDETLPTSEIVPLPGNTEKAMECEADDSIYSEESVMCAFEMDVDSLRDQSCEAEPRDQSKDGSDDMISEKYIKRMQRMSKMLAIDDTSFVAAKSHKTRKSICLEDAPESMPEMRVRRSSRSHSRSISGISGEVQPQPEKLMATVTAESGVSGLNHAISNDQKKSVDMISSEYADHFDAKQESIEKRSGGVPLDSSVLEENEANTSKVSTVSFMANQDFGLSISESDLTNEVQHSNDSIPTSTPVDGFKECVTGHGSLCIDEGNHKQEIHRKRKKRTGPKLCLSEHIFDLLAPLEEISPLKFDRIYKSNIQDPPLTCPISNYHSSDTNLESENLSVESKPKMGANTAATDQPIYFETHEDYGHMVLPVKVTQSFVKMFRTNISTECLNVPYICQTILVNHQNKCLQNLDAKLVRVISDELSIHNPCVDELVDTFFNILCQLKTSDYEFFKTGTIEQRLIKSLFFKITSLKKVVSPTLQRLLSFAIKLSVKCRDLSSFRAFMIKVILTCNFQFVTNIFQQIINHHNILILIGSEQLCYKKKSDELVDIQHLYLAGLEFYVRFSQVKCTPVGKLKCIHQFAVEGHLLHVAVDAILSSGSNTDLQKEGHLCIQLMLKSQGWGWFTSTLLPIILDKLATCTHSDICRLQELIGFLVASEVITQRADMTLVREKLLPTLIGLLWTAPTPEIKFSIAKSIVNLSPVAYEEMMTQLQNWVKSLRPPTTEHEDFATIRQLILDTTSRASKCTVKSNSSV